MPRRIAIFDTTLRDGEQAGFSMNLDEKLEVARSSRVSASMSSRRLSARVPGLRVGQGDRASFGATIASLARAVDKEIDAAWERCAERSARGST